LGERVLNWITGLCLFVMMLLTFFDVGGRYLFGAPIPGAFEITQLLLAVLVFTALPLVTGREQHVSISLIEQTFKGGVKKLQRLIVSLTCMVMLGYLSIVLWRLALRIGSYGDYTAYLQIPLAPFAYVMSLFSGLAAAILLFLAWRYLMTPSHAFNAGLEHGTGEL
tara:strand:- start:344 stop:841 length:498 start_codon:yes stop_codon:yes gene_type:complete